MYKKQKDFSNISYIFLIIIFSQIIGCSKSSWYSRAIFWDAKIKPTPFEQPKASPHPKEWDPNKTTFTWLGHSTVLLNYNNITILTDPILLKRIGPPEIFDNAFGIRRIMKLPLNISDLPSIDLILISHSHYDHLDIPSLKKLVKAKLLDNATIVLPRDTKELFSSLGLEVIELDWLLDKNQKEINLKNKDIQICSFKVEHYSYVNWGDRKKPRGFNGYVIRSKSKKENIAFWGDTTYIRYRDEKGYKIESEPKSVNWKTQIKYDETECSSIDLCIIPIGDSYFYKNHMGPKDTIKLFKDVGCKQLLPIHYGTFILTPRDKEPKNPKNILLEELINNGIENIVNCIDKKGRKVYPDVGVECTLF